MKKIFKSTQGFAIAYVILAAVVVSVIGATVYQVSSTNAEQVNQKVDSTQAYLYSKSGIELAVGYVMRNLETIPLTEEGGEGLVYYGNLSTGQFTTTRPEDGEADIEFSIKATENEVVEDGFTKKETKFLISSVGLSNSVTAMGDSGTAGGGTETEGGTAGQGSLSFEITNTAIKKHIEGGEIIRIDEEANILDAEGNFRYAVFADQGISLDNSITITGPVGLNAGTVSSKANAYINGTLFLGPNAPRNSTYTSLAKKVQEYDTVKPLPQVPQWDIAAQKIMDISITPENPIIKKPFANADETLTPGSITEYAKIDLSNKNVTFYLNGNAVVIANNLVVGGEIKLSGNGRLLLVVQSNLSGKLLINQSGETSKLDMILNGSQLNMDNQSVVHAKMYYSGATGTIKNSKIDGFIYAPNAVFTVTGGSKTDVTGNLIVKTLKMDSNAEIIYEDRTSGALPIDYNPLYPKPTNWRVTGTWIDS